MIGIFAKNREEWAVTDIANALYGYTMVPLYDTLGPDSISYVLFNSQIESCYCGAAGVTTISKTKDLHKLKNLIVFD
jgi:long-chain acyl-CoA synthetase